jgi:CRP/FNR family cyclic AMP-dependent transcriptional regulator
VWIHSCRNCIIRSGSFKIYLPGWNGNQTIMNNEAMNNVASNICKCMKADNTVFGFLNDTNAEELCKFFDCKTVSAGETLWEEGAPCDYVAIIVSGRVEIKKQTEFEGRHMVVGVIGGGSVVGALCILDEQPRAVTADALEDVTLLTITHQKLEQLISTHQDLGVKLLKGVLMSVSLRLRRCFGRLTSFF